MKAVILFSLFLSGCAGAKIVNTTVAPLGGTVEYKNGNFVKEKSREMALKEMTDFCKGPYKIENEQFNPDVLSFQFNGGQHYTLGKGNFMYIKFTCVK